MRIVAFCRASEDGSFGVFDASRLALFLGWVFAGIVFLLGASPGSLIGMSVESIDRYINHINRQTII
jgi:hypothetical protein